MEGLFDIVRRYSGSVTSYVKIYSILNAVSAFAGRKYRHSDSSILHGEHIHQRSSALKILPESNEARQRRRSKSCKQNHRLLDNRRFQI